MLSAEQFADDANGDGVLSAAEQRAYAERVLGDLSPTLDHAQAGAGSGPLSLAWWSGPGGWLGAAALLPAAWLTVRRRQRAEGAHAAVAAR